MTIDLGSTAASALSKNCLAPTEICGASTLKIKSLSYPAIEAQRSITINNFISDLDMVSSDIPDIWHGGDYMYFHWGWDFGHQPGYNGYLNGYLKNLVTSQLTQVLFNYNGSTRQCVLQIPSGGYTPEEGWYKFVVYGTFNNQPYGESRDQFFIEGLP